MSRLSRFWLGIAILIHLTMLVSWRTGLLNPFFFDATVTHGRRGWDFYALYQAGHNVLTGHSAYESDGTRIHMVIPDGAYTPFRYLPVSAYTVGVLLNLLPPLWAYRLWVAGIELCLLFCVFLTARLVSDRDRRARLVAMWLGFTPFYLELYMGQFSFVQATLIWVMLIWPWLRTRWTRWSHSQWGSDLAWIASVLWKQNTALFLPWMIRARHWRALIALTALLALTTLPYFALFPDAAAAFARNLSGEPPWFQLGNLGLRQLIFDAMWSAADTFQLTISPGLYAGAQTAAVCIFWLIPLALTILDPHPNALTHLSLWLTSYFMAYHHVWEHHYVMLLPVLVALCMRHRSRWLWIIYVALALPTPFYLIDPHGQVAVLDAMRWTPIRPLWQDLLYHASKSIPALLLYLWLVFQIARPILGARRQEKL